MAVNRVFELEGTTLPLLGGITSTTCKSGDPCRIGQIPGVAAIDAASSKTVVYTRGIFTIPVLAEASAIEIGDILYYDDGDTTPVNNESGGNVRFGYALEHIDNLATKTIMVMVGY